MSKINIMDIDSDNLASLVQDPRWEQVELVLAQRAESLLNRLATAPIKDVIGIQARIGEINYLTRELEKYKGGKK
jgi:hypothetical protein